MTFLEKNIYNTFLRISRSRNNLPYKTRKNFDNFEDSEHYVFVKRLSIFFNKFPHISIDDFFNAPYDVYPDDDMYDLKFYTSPKATKMYGLYVKKRNEESPDSESQIQFIKSSLFALYEYCRDNNLNLRDYTKNMTGDIHTFIMHLHDRRVSIYTLYGFSDVEKILNSYPKTRLEFTLGKDFTNNLASYKVRFYNSERAKRICTDGLAKIKNILNKTQDNI